MLHLIAYDISDHKRLRRVAKICEDYGRRVEKSVFECDISEELFAKFWAELNHAVIPEEDYLLAYRICASCAKSSVTAGAAERPKKRTAYVF